MSSYYVFVLDYSSGIAHRFTINEMECDDTEEFLTDKGFKLGNINWMSTSIKELETDE